jgi:hypothetical protein
MGNGGELAAFLRSRRERLTPDGSGAISMSRAQGAPREQWLTATLTNHLDARCVVNVTSTGLRGRVAMRATPEIGGCVLSGGRLAVRAAPTRRFCGRGTLLRSVVSP